MSRASRGSLAGLAALLAVVAVVALPGCKRDEARAYRATPPSPAAPTPTPTPAPSVRVAANTPLTPSAAPLTPSAAPLTPSAAPLIPSAAPEAAAPHAAGPALAAPAAGGCGKPVGSPPRGTTHTSAGRTYHVWAPASYDGKQPLPVVLVFHGWYATGPAFQAWFKMEEHVAGSALVVYPDAEGPTWHLDDRDISFVARTLDELSAAYCIDRARVLAFGFSYGGKFTHKLGCSASKLVKAIAVGDGSLGGGLSGCGNLPVLVTHRTRDDDERFAWGKSAAEAWAGVNGCTKELTPTDVQHGCAAFNGCKPGAPVTFCEDTYFNTSWPHDWNHTVREEYRDLTWQWFARLP